MKTIPITLAILVTTYLLGRAEEGESKSPDAPVEISALVVPKAESKAPAGMITAIRENGTWKFKIQTRSTGWKTSGSISDMTIRGEGFEIPIAINSVSTLPDMDNSYTFFIISDDMAKTATLYANFSSVEHGAIKMVSYEIKLSELIK